jgi:tRNA pseudouridine38-40 synthase
MDSVREQLNAVLPPEFRVLDVMRTTRAFCAHTQRDRVRYTYMIPSFLFAQNVRSSAFEKVLPADILQQERENSWDPLSADEVAKLQAQLAGVRATSQQLTTLKEALKAYEGTHSFHNFTKGVKPSEARAKRYIVSFQVEDPVVINGEEWIPTQVLGQSFLLHQIRKMVCMAIEVTRGVATAETVNRAFENDDAIRIGIAPAQGLYMDMSYYEGYNRRKPDAAEVEDIDWAKENTPSFQRWKDFRSETLMRHLVSQEEKEGNFVKFLFSQEYCFNREDAYDPEKRSYHGFKDSNSDEEKTDEDNR